MKEKVTSEIDLEMTRQSTVFGDLLFIAVPLIIITAGVILYTYFSRPVAKVIVAPPSHSTGLSQEEVQKRSYDMGVMACLTTFSQGISSYRQKYGADKTPTLEQLQTREFNGDHCTAQYGYQAKAKVEGQALVINMTHEQGSLIFSMTPAGVVSIKKGDEKNNPYFSLH